MVGVTDMLDELKTHIKDILRQRIGKDSDNTAKKIEKFLKERHVIYI
jgi:hypothetical protein